MWSNIARRLAAPLLLLTMLPAVSIASPLLGGRSDVVVGLGPYQPVLADLNKDGNLDLVVALTEPKLSVLLGAGDGTFGPVTEYSTVSVAGGVVVADLNNDGNLDVANVNTSSNSLSVRFGVGDGTFGAPTTYGTGFWPVELAAGDFNLDGWLDLAVANVNTVTISVLLNTGTGAFNGMAPYTTGGSPQALAVADIDNDGKPDIMTANYTSNTVSFLRGAGDGSFPTHVEFPTAPRPFKVAIGDLNADGKLDLAVADDDYYGGTGWVSVLMGSGTGSFAPHVDYATDHNPRCVAIADLDRDGKPDLVSANFGYNSPGNSVTVLLGNGNGTFGRRADYGVGSHPISLAIGDVNSDDRPDVVTANGGASTASVLLNQPLPRIAGVRDVLGDQGGRVKVLWDASRRDLSPYSDIESYWVLRSAPAAALARARAGAFGSLDPDVQVEPRVGAVQAFQSQGTNYYWEYVASQPAFHSANYSYVAETTCDSLGSANPKTAFMIMARTAGGAQWWFSEPDSGYSVDNLPPAAPAPFTGTYAAGTSVLHWNPSAAADLASYRLYRGPSAGFVPGPANLIASPQDTTFTDAAGAPNYYRLAAVDVHGNEGPTALLFPTMTNDVPTVGDITFALAGVRPNPVHGGRLSVTFSLARAGSARIDLLDVGGRRVASREVGALGTGSHTVDLAASRSLAPGLYLIKLTQGTESRITRVALLD